MYRKFAPNSDLQTTLNKHFAHGGGKLPLNKPIKYATQKMDVDSPKKITTAMDIDTKPIVSGSKMDVQFKRGFGNAQLQRSVYNIIKNNAHLITVCARDNNIDLEHVLDKQSASDTIQLLAKFNKSINGVNGIFFKVFFAPKGFYTIRDRKGNETNQKVKNNSLTIEAEIYAKVVNRLLFSRSTPHLIAYYGLVEHCSVLDVVKNLHKESEKIAFDNAIKSYFTDESLKGNYDLYKMYMLALEKSTGQPLGKLSAYVKGNKVSDQWIARLHNENTWPQILFQIVWTLLCFKDVGLMHNDLHSGNVFITDKLNVPQKDIVYFVSRNEIYYVANQELFVQIYDFDRGTKRARNLPHFHEELHNTTLDIFDCNALNSCNKYEEKTDITRILEAILYAFPESAKAISYIADIRFLQSLTPKNGYAYPGVSCLKTNVREVCDYKRPTDAQIKPLHEMLHILGEMLGARTTQRDQLYLHELVKRENDYFQIYALPSSWAANERSVSKIFSSDK